MAENARHRMQNHVDAKQHAEKYQQRRTDHHQNTKNQSSPGHSVVADSSESKARHDKYGDLSDVRKLTYEDRSISSPTNEIKHKEESAWEFTGEVLLPFLVAGLGMAFAGITLDTVRANLGHMELWSEQRKMIVGNLALTQVQAVVVGLLAAVFAVILGWLTDNELDVFEAVLLCTSSVMTAALASFILGSIMISVVILSSRYKINPDNVATPIAASLGDLTTVSLLAAVSALLYNTRDTMSWISPLLLGIALLVTPLCWNVANSNEYTRCVLQTGWTPVIGAMVISSLGGLILDHAIVSFEGIAAFQPVINGVGGNLVAVHASRLSTLLHKLSKPGLLPHSMEVCLNPLNTFVGTHASAKTARVLLSMTVPGHIVFIYAIKALQSGNEFNLSVPFAVVYLGAAFLQVGILLCTANWLVGLLWSSGSDPDNASIPYLTAFGDLLGTVLLAGVFYLVPLSV